MSKQLNQIKAYAKKNKLPLIPIKAKDISLIYEPEQFYLTILDQIKRSKQRIALSALYIGSGSKEKSIIQSILGNLATNDGLNVNIALDSNRANRIDKDNESSVTILQRVLDYQNVRLTLIETGRKNSLLNCLLGKFQRWNELLSTYHAKFLIFDENIILTGANLSSIYFERRQDRYLVLKNSRILSDYMFNFLGQLEKGKSIKESVYKHNIEYVEQLNNEDATNVSDSYIIPLMQHGPSGLRDKEEFLEFLCSILPESTNIHMSSGYFNPSSTINGFKLNSVLAPSEMSNGFYNGGRLLKHVPHIYTAIYKNYKTEHRDCKLLLFDRPDWSFHAKGIWFECMDDFYIHLIGSSNFNLRSSERDFETQLLLLTSNKSLIEKLQKERDLLWSHSRQADIHELNNVNWLYSVAAKFLKSFL